MSEVNNNILIAILFILGGRQGHRRRDFSRRRRRNDVHEHTELGREGSRQTNGKRYRKVAGKESLRRTRPTPTDRREKSTSLRTSSSTLTATVQSSIRYFVIL
jgi:hypothetical protein